MNGGKHSQTIAKVSNKPLLSGLIEQFRTVGIEEIVAISDYRREIVGKRPVGEVNRNRFRHRRRYPEIG